MCLITSTSKTDWPMGAHIGATALKWHLCWLKLAITLALSRGPLTSSRVNYQVVWSYFYFTSKASNSKQSIILWDQWQLTNNAEHKEITQWWTSYSFVELCFWELVIILFISCIWRHILLQTRGAIHIICPRIFLANSWWQKCAKKQSNEPTKAVMKASNKQTWM